MQSFLLSNPFRSALWVATTTLCLCLISTGSASAQNLTQTQQQIVTNLQTASSTLKQQITYGLQSTSNFSTAATNGYIVDPTAYQSLTISSTTLNNYNNTLSTFQGTSFYTAQQFLNDQATAQIANMQAAIQSLATAAVDLQSAATVNQIVAGITDSPTAKAAQATIANSGLSTEIAQGQVDAFNSSLSMVNAYATQAGAFFASAKNTTITSNIDLAASNYNKTLYTATAGYDYSNDYLGVNFDSTYSIGFNGFTTDRQIAATDFFTRPQLYGGQ